MGSLQTKNKGNKILLGLSLLMLCFSFIFFSYSVSDLSFAEDDFDVSYEDENEEDGLINLDDYVVLTGVANTVEYLTAMYLYVDNPNSLTSVVLQYDSGLNALLINSAINANALGIGYNNFGEGVAGSVFVGGSGNNLNMRSMSVLDEYGDTIGLTNSNSDSSVIIGGEKNTLGPVGTVSIGGKDNHVNASNLAIIGSNNVRVDNSAITVVLGGKTVSFGAGGGYGFYAGNNLRGGYSTYLIGSGIDTQSKQHYSLNLQNAFAWSDTLSGLQIKGGDLGGQPGFYVNAENGLGLNTSTPRLTYDARSGGPLRLLSARGMNGELMSFTSGEGILCDDEKANGKFRGTVIYVELLDDSNQFVSAGFCGCNGKEWTPMSNDTVTQYVCANTYTGDRKCLPLDKHGLDHVVFHTGTEGVRRWDEEGNGGSGEWIDLNWTFGGVPGLFSGTQRECVYSCEVGYHPGTKSPQGWFTGDCIACTKPNHSIFISPGTGMDDCQFACDAGYKYNGWLTGNDRLNKGCTPCNYGEWSTGRNQTLMCDKCEYPVGISAKGLKFYSGSMWDSIAKTGSGEPYFRAFTNFSTKGKYGCDFDCASGFVYSFAGTAGGNSCTECGTGEYSDGGKATSCGKCTNKPTGLIAYSWTDMSGDFHSSNNNQIGEKDVAWYTSKGLTGANSCNWTCNSTIGLVKVQEDGAWKCKCPDGTHLETVGGSAKCVSNKVDAVCQGELGSLAIRGYPMFTGAEGDGSWINWSWLNARKTWTYSTKTPDKLGVCEWTCPHGYTVDESGNNCKPILVGECSSINGTVVSSDYPADFWDSSSNLCVPGKVVDGGSLNVTKVHINYYDTTKPVIFQFYPTSSNPQNTNEIKYLVSWTCEGYEHDPKFSASCYAYWAGSAADGKCSNDQRVDGKAKAICATDLSNCNVNRTCPPLRDEKASSDGHGKTWECLGVFGGKRSPICHSCDEEYVWDFSEGKCVEDKDRGYCEGWRPADSDELEMGPESFVIPFDPVLDDYTPKTLPYTLRTGNINLGPCEYRCKEGYVWKRSSAKCVPISEEYECSGDKEIANAIYGAKTYRKVFSVIKDDYELVPSTLKTWFHFVDKTNQLSECELTCEGGYYWDESSFSCIEYPPTPEYPLCGTITDDCEDHDKCVEGCDDDSDECISGRTSCEGGCDDDLDDCYDDCDDGLDECKKKCDDDLDDCKDDCDEDCEGTCDSCKSGCPECVPNLKNACERGDISGDPSKKGPNDYRWTCVTEYGSIECGEGKFYSCETATITNAHAVGKRENLTYEEYTTYKNKLYTISDAPGIPCSFACNEGYSFLVNSDYPEGACVICKEGNMSEKIEYCTIMVDGKCSDDEYYDEDSKKCYRLDNCYNSSKIDNTIPEHAYVPGYGTNPIYFRPLDAGGNKIHRRCDENSSNISPNTCSYTCEEGYYCTSSSDNGLCVQGPFKCFNGHKNQDSAYIYENPTVTSEKRRKNTLYVEPIYVEGNFDNKEDFFSFVFTKYGDEGCYFACKSGYFHYGESSVLSNGCYSSAELNAYECSSTYPSVGGFLEKTKNPQEDGQEWKWRENYEEYEKIKSDGCAVTCQPGSRIITSGSKKICLKNCPEGKYFSEGGFILGGGCYSCDEGYIPDTKNDLLDGVPTKCVNACKNFGDDLVYDQKSGTCVGRYHDAGTCESHGGEWKWVDGKMQCVIGVPTV